MLTNENFVITASDDPINELRVAVLRQAFEDYYTGQLVEVFMRRDDVPGNFNKSHIQRLRRWNYYIVEARRNAADAKNFLGSEWARELAGELNLRACMDGVNRHAVQDIADLKKPITIYRRGANGQPEMVRAFDRLYDCGRYYYPKKLNPAYIMRAVHVRKRDGAKVVSFSHNDIVYRGVLGE